MKILKEIFDEETSKLNGSLNPKISSLYSLLIENDAEEIETLDFLRKDYPLAGIKEYYLIKLNHSQRGKDFLPIEGFFFYGNNEEARKYFSGQIPDRILDKEFGTENENNGNSDSWKEYDAEEP